MRASGNGPMGAMLMIAPLVVVPVLAVIGIPQFAPVVASPGSDGELASSDAIDSLERGSVRLGHSARHAADDLFAPPGGEGESESDEEFDERDEQRDSFDLDAESFESESYAGRPDRRRPAARTRPAVRSRADSRRSSAESDPLSGWEVDPQGDAGGEAREEFAPANEITEEELAEFDALEAAPQRRSSRALSGSGSRGRVSARTVSSRGYDDETTEDASVEPAEMDADAFEEFESDQPRVDAAAADDTLVADAAANPVRGGLERPAKFQPMLERPTHQRNRRPETADFEGAPRRRASSFPESSVRAQSTDAAVGEEGPESDAPLFEPSPQAKRQAPARTQAQPRVVADLTWRGATARLKQLGIRKHYFTYVEDRDTFLFCCALTPSDDPGVTQKFEAEADEPLLAVRDVLQQISDWQNGK